MTEYTANLECTIVVSFLRRKAEGCKKHAQSLLADTIQNKPDANLWELMSQTIEECADDIEAGRHRQQ